jgi:hypothetical protein
MDRGGVAGPALQQLFPSTLTTSLAVSPRERRTRPSTMALAECHDWLETLLFR